MNRFLLIGIWLPLVSAYPSYLDCTTDSATHLKIGTKIMGVPVTQASGVTIQALRNKKPTSSYREGEILELEIKGFAAGSSAVVRTNDASNSTIDAKDTSGVFAAKCAGQAYVPDGKQIAGSSISVPFRPGCMSKFAASASAAPLEMTFVTVIKGPGNPVLLSKLSLTNEGKSDPSCHGGVVPTPPPPPELSTTYANLVWVHRFAVITSWGFLFPLGVALVRFYPSGSRMKLHRILQVSGLFVEIIDFACIYSAHNIGKNGLGPVDGHFAGTQGSSPGVTHKQRGLAVFVFIWFQLVLGVFRPAPFPNNLKRRVWLWSHRTVGDGAMIIAWVQIWESVAVVTEYNARMTLTIVALLFMVNAALLAPIYFMLVASKSDRELENESMSIVSPNGSVIESMPRQVSNTSEHPRDAMFFRCGHCNQVFTSEHILKVHIQFTHPGLEYKEVCSPMTQRFAEVSNIPAVTDGLPLSKVKKHNKAGDCWVVLNGKVYDLTNFLNAHPGGPNPILSWAGRDASRTWNLIHQKSWIDRYQTIECLGQVAPEPAVEGMPSPEKEGLHQRGSDLRTITVTDSTACSAAGMSSDMGQSLMTQQAMAQDSGN